MSRCLAGTAAALIVAACGAGPAGAPTPEPSITSMDGEAILERTCTACHDLGGLSAFSDFWGEPEWRSLIDTMISYGAVVAPAEYEVLAGYLASEY